MFLKIFASVVAFMFVTNLFVQLCELYTLMYWYAKFCKINAKNTFDKFYVTWSIVNVYRSCKDTEIDMSLKGIVRQKVRRLIEWPVTISNRFDGIYEFNNIAKGQYQDELASNARG